MKSAAIVQLIDSFVKIESYNERVESIYMTPEFFDQIINEESFDNFVKSENGAKSDNDGILGSLFGANVYVHKNLNKSYLVSEHGRMVEINNDDTQEEKKIDNKVKFKFILEEN